MKNIKLFILLLALGSVPGYLTAEDEASAEEESKAAVPSNPQELLEVVTVSYTQLTLPTPPYV